MFEKGTCNNRKTKLERDIFEFHYICNGTSVIQSKSMSFRCPICEGFHLAIGLTDYIPHHDFYLGREFFCGNCFSQYQTLFDNKIKLISRSLLWS